MSCKRDMRQLVQRIRASGIEVVVPTRGGHYKVLAPKGVVFLSRTPSDRRALDGAISDLRRNGVSL